MTTAGALLMILTGAAIMAFGLFIFYAWLPILYGLIGFEIGLLVGAWLTGETGWTAILLGIVGALILWAASFFLEPYRRILIGVSGGFLLGLAIAAVVGLDAVLGGILGLLLAVLLGTLGGFLVPRLFDTMVVVASSAAGATMVMNGASFLLPGLDLLDRSSGRFLPALLAAGLTVIGIGWQITNVGKWIGSTGVTGVDDTSKPHPHTPPGSRS